MNTNFYEIDLLQKYKNTLSKRYRGYNRVFQVNLNHFDREKQDLLQGKQKTNDHKNKSPLIEYAKNCFSESHSREIQVEKGMIIKSTNTQFIMKQGSSETKVDGRIFMKKKLLKLNNVIGQIQDYEDNKSEILRESQKNSHDKSIDSTKFKFRKRLVKQLIQCRKYANQDQLLQGYSQQSMFTPFSPIVRGQKKHAFQLNNKKTKTSENQALDNQSKKNLIAHRSPTDVQKNQAVSKLPTSKKIPQHVKRNSSYAVKKLQNQHKQEGGSLCNSVQPQNFTKYFSSNFDSKKSLSSKIPHSNISLPKINCEKQLSSKQLLSMGTFLNPINSSELQISKNIEKYRKYPLLFKYPFDVKNIESESYIVMEAESQIILWGYRTNNTYQIASLTKIMTFYVVLKLIKQYNIDPTLQKIQVQQKNSNVGGTSAQLFSGQFYTVQNLLYGLMLPSGNDAALALAVWGGKLKCSNPQDMEGCISKFVRLMNKQAKHLNLQDTRYGNPHGLPHALSRSTAFDVAKLCIQCMKNEFFKQVVGTKSYKCIVTTVDGKKRINEWENTNKLLRREGFVGLKTGITVTAGPCLASAFCFKGKTYISVILRAKKVSRRFKQTRKILHWCLNKRYENDLSGEQIQRLKRLKKNNLELDSDYSEEESIFRYDKNSNKELQKRCDIISEM